MVGRSFVVRGALGVAAVAAVLGAAGTAGAEQPRQTDPVYCQWGGDGPLAQRYCDNDRGTDSGSAAGSGSALGHMLGRLLFGNHG